MVEYQAKQGTEPYFKKWHFMAIIAAILGMLVSFYTLYHHYQVLLYGETGAFCNISATFNCDAVASSEYSTFLGFPLGVWGLGYFLTILLSLIFSLKGIGKRKDQLFIYSLSVLVGCLTSVALAYISAVFIKAACLACIGVYTVTGLQAILWFLAYRKGVFSFGGSSWKSLKTGFINSVIAFVPVLLIYSGIQGYLASSEPSEPFSQQDELEALDLSSSFAEAVDIPTALTPYSGLGEDYRKGPDNAKVKIQVFSDFQCPACRNIEKLIDSVYEKFQGRVQVVYRNFPLDASCNRALRHKKHEYACAIAKYARCAGHYEKFWDYHDLAFDNQRSLADGVPREWARTVGLTEKQVKDCESDKSVEEKLKEDVELGIELQVEATPTIFVNGRRFVGNYQNFESAIKSLLES